MAKGDGKGKTPAGNFNVTFSVSTRYISQSFRLGILPWPVMPNKLIHKIGIVYEKLKNSELIDEWRD